MNFFHIIVAICFMNEKERGDALGMSENHSIPKKSLQRENKEI